MCCRVVVSFAGALASSPFVTDSSLASLSRIAAALLKLPNWRYQGCRRDAPFLEWGKCPVTNSASDNYRNYATTKL